MRMISIRSHTIVRANKVSLLLQRSRIHTSCTVLKKGSDDVQKITSLDLSSALKHTSKLRVTNKELETLDEELEIHGNHKVDQRYTKDLNKNVLPQEVQKMIKKRPVNSTKNKQEDTQLREKTNSKVLNGITRENEKKHSRTWISRNLLARHNMKKLFNSKKEADVEKNTINFNEEFKQVNSIDSASIPRLAHNLDRALFSPGVHFLQDPRTRIYNFTPYLKKIIKLEDFNFDAIEPFVSVSKDTTLLKAASENNKMFYSSTSSMTSTLIQFYLLLNNYNPDSTDRFNFPKFSGVIERIASSVVVQPKGVNEKTGETIYAVESDKSADTEILLSAMGHCLEALLTTEENEFEKYTNKYKDKIVNQPQPQNVYNYATYGDFLMRSQLDCYDERLPGNGTFDLKTRAVCAIRHDSVNPELENNKYQIWKLNGQFESFEREFNDLIRTGALLKYGFQARIGQMDGIYIAYHNINSFFGFQYLPLSEIDNIFYNHTNNERYKHFNLKNIDEINDDMPSYVAETQFKMSLSIWENLLKRIIKDFPPSIPFRLVMKTIKSPNSADLRVVVSAVPLDENQVSKLQTLPKAFKTSFREDLSQEERLKNLRAHRDELNDFNKESAKAGVHTYYIDVDQLFGKYCSRDIHAYPRSKDQKWNVNYSITKVNDNAKLYLDHLSVASNMVVSSFERSSSGKKPSYKNDEFDFGENNNLMQIYSTIGEARAKKWEEKDNNPSVYNSNDM